MLKHMAVSLLIASFFLGCCGNCDVLYKSINISGRVFKVEVADTQKEREIGLSGRTLEQNEGMLFVFENPCRPAFWMKGVPEPLDIIWIDNEKKVISILENLPVVSGDDYDIYRSPSKISFVIELKGGTAKSIGLETGQVLDI
ncbi:MAG: DUF192 domain-containing protein [Candidatus Margulisiibacteriota bacterium]